MTMTAISVFREPLEVEDGGGGGRFSVVAIVLFFIYIPVLIGIDPWIRFAVNVGSSGSVHGSEKAIFWSLNKGLW